MAIMDSGMVENERKYTVGIRCLLFGRSIQNEEQNVDFESHFDEESMIVKMDS